MTRYLIAGVVDSWDTQSEIVQVNLPKEIPTKMEQDKDKKEGRKGKKEIDQGKVMIGKEQMK